MRRSASRRSGSWRRAARRLVPPALPPAGHGTEGFLFPKTYRFSEGRTSAERRGPTDARAVRHGGRRRSPWTNAERLGVSPYEIVIDRVDDRTGGPGSSRPAEDRGGHLQPAGGRHDARDRRDARCTTTRHLTAQLSLRLRDRQSVQHPAACRSAAHADRQPRASLAPCRALTGRRPVPLLRALRRRRPSSVQRDLRPFLHDKAVCLG